MESSGTSNYEKFQDSSRPLKRARPLNVKILVNALVRGYYCSTLPHQQAPFTHIALEFCKNPPTDVPRGGAFPRELSLGLFPSVLLSQSFVLCLYSAEFLLVLMGNNRIIKSEAIRAHSGQRL